MRTRAARPERWIVPGWLTLDLRHAALVRSVVRLRWARAHTASSLSSGSGGRTYEYERASWRCFRHCIGFAAARSPAHLPGLLGRGSSTALGRAYDRVVAAGRKVTHPGRLNVDPPLVIAGIMPACWEERT